ncbi:MAG: peptidase T [Sediminispirochaetaceae bacterium]
MTTYDRTWLKEQLLDRFIRYVKIDTTSDRQIEEIPSTPGQWDLLNLLKKEVLELGIEDITLNSNGYLIIKVPARGLPAGGTPAEGSSAGGPSAQAAPAKGRPDSGPAAQGTSAGATPAKGKPASGSTAQATPASGTSAGGASGEASQTTIGLMAHVDTASDVSGKNVKPQVFENYQGGDLSIGNGLVLKADENPMLAESFGDTIITSDGSTLLGADDKAGVAEIMTALTWLMNHPDVSHGPLEIIFTPDEETGKGMNLFPLDSLEAECCYTFDGGERGTIEGECFNAYAARILFTGNVVHLGIARGKLVNAVTMASHFVSLLPRNESPEATDGRYGYYTPFEIRGDLEKAELNVYLRDFESDGMERRLAVLQQLAEAVEAVFPGGKVKVESKRLYTNMRDYINREPRIMEMLEEAIRRTGVEPERRIIRGGTDGSRLSEMGIPTPNVFTGGYNFHSRLEWASLNTMVEAAETAINLVRLWGEG